MKNFIKMFSILGLGENEANIYLKLLENGICTIGELSKATSLHRTQLYRMLPFLIESGFVIKTIEGKKKYYSPASPEVFKDSLNEIIERNSQNILHLQSLYNNLEEKPIITYNKGSKGITNVFSDIISSSKKGDTFYRITSEIDTEFINNNYLPKNYRENRDKKELERYVIMSNKASKSKGKKLERDIKIVPEKIDEFDDNVFMSIYAEKVAFIDFNTESSIIIENKQIANFQKKLFKMLYKSL